MIRRALVGTSERLVAIKLPYVRSASVATADRLTRAKGAFKNMTEGVRAARAAGLPLQLTIIIARYNVDDVDRSGRVAPTAAAPAGSGPSR